MFDECTSFNCCFVVCVSVLPALTKDTCQVKQARLWVHHCPELSPVPWKQRNNTTHAHCPAQCVQAALACRQSKTTPPVPHASLHQPPAQRQGPKQWQHEHVQRASASHHAVCKGLPAAPAVASAAASAAPEPRPQPARAPQPVASKQVSAAGCYPPSRQMKNGLITLLLPPDRPVRAADVVHSCIEMKAQRK